MKFKEISSLIPELLSGAMGLPIDSVQAQPLGNPRPDLRVRLGEYSFVVEFKHAGTAEAVGAGVRTLAPYRTVADDLTIPEAPSITHPAPDVERSTNAARPPTCRPRRLLNPLPVCATISLSRIIKETTRGG